MAPPDVVAPLAIARRLGLPRRLLVVLEGEEPLGDSAHQFYDQIVAKLQADDQHVEHVQDMWSDPLSAAG